MCAPGRCEGRCPWRREGSGGKSSSQQLWIGKTYAYVPHMICIHACGFQNYVLHSASVASQLSADSLQRLALHTTR
jgi:hypothetical protein